MREVAAAGETMPPKSTYFFPKLLTGMVFNPLSWPPVVKIYTRKGDDGTTSLWYGGRVAKTDARTEAYGSLDEAGAALGVARSLCGPDDAELAADILRLQRRAVRRRRRAGDRARGRRAPRGRGQPDHRRDGRPRSSRSSTATWTRSTCRRSS